MRYFILKSIKFYQRVLSPIFYCLKPYSGCRFFPSCSEYGYRAVEKYGAVRGILRTIKRICRCHPLCKGGYDPI